MVPGLAMALALSALILGAAVELPPANAPTLVSPQPPDVVVPFGCGRAYPVSQGHRTGSHLQNDSWAWDFRMPEGVPIVAALDGIVRVVRGDSHVGGCDPRFAAESNYVDISHADGWEA